MEGFIEIICLYLKSYISIDVFIDYIYKNMDEVEMMLSEDVLLELISVNPINKVSVEKIIVMLNELVKSRYLNEYNLINDTYIDNIINSNRNDFVAIYLREKSKRKESIVIDISDVSDEKELIKLFKDKLEFPEICGNSWDALNDLIYDINLPSKIVVNGFYKMEHSQNKINNLFSKIKDVCQIIYG